MFKFPEEWDEEPEAIQFVEPPVRTYAFRFSGLNWLVGVTFLATVVMAFHAVLVEKDFFYGVVFLGMAIVMVGTNAFTEYKKCEGDIPGGTQMTASYACSLCKHGVIVVAQVRANYEGVEPDLLGVAYQAALVQHYHNYHQN